MGGGGGGVAGLLQLHRTTYFSLKLLASKRVGGGPLRARAGAGGESSVRRPYMRRSVSDDRSMVIALLVQQQRPPFLAHDRRGIVLENVMLLSLPVFAFACCFR